MRVREASIRGVAGLGLVAVVGALSRPLSGGGPDPVLGACAVALGGALGGLSGARREVGALWGVVAADALALAAALAWVFVYAENPSWMGVGVVMALGASCASPVLGAAVLIGAAVAGRSVAELIRPLGFGAAIAAGGTALLVVAVKLAIGAL